MYVWFITCGCFLRVASVYSYTKIYGKQFYQLRFTHFSKQRDFYMKEKLNLMQVQKMKIAAGIVSENTGRPPNALKSINQSCHPHSD